MLHANITGKIINAFYKVNNTLGFGFLEKVYENAMAIELRKMGCKVLQQKNIKVYYENEEVGDYFADLLVDDLVIVELKAAENLCYQCHPCSIWLLKPLKDEKYRFISNGHGVGSGWTYLAEALRIGDRNLFRKGMDVLRWHFTKGWDFKYGGVIFIIPAQSC